MYFDILNNDINNIIFSKLNYYSMISINKIIDINFTNLFIIKYLKLYINIINVFKNDINKCEYGTLYKDLLKYNEPTIYNQIDDENITIIIKNRYNRIINNFNYSIGKFIKPFLSLFTINTLTILKLYNKNKNIINRLKLYPAVNNLSYLYNKDFIKEYKENILILAYETTIDANILSKYVYDGEISNNDRIILTFEDIMIIDNIIFIFHLLYLLIKENKKEVIYFKKNEIQKIINYLRTYHLQNANINDKFKYNSNEIFYYYLNSDILKNIYSFNFIEN